MQCFQQQSDRIAIKKCSNMQCFLQQSDRIAIKKCSNMQCFLQQSDRIAIKKCLNMQCFLQQSDRKAIKKCSNMQCFLQQSDRIAIKKCSNMQCFLQQSDRRAIKKCSNMQCFLHIFCCNSAYFSQFAQHRKKEIFNFLYIRHWGSRGASWQSVRAVPAPAAPRPRSCGIRLQQRDADLEVAHCTDRNKHWWITDKNTVFLWYSGFDLRRGAWTLSTGGGGRKAGC